MTDPLPKKTLSLAHLKQPTATVAPPEPLPRRYVWREEGKAEVMKEIGPT